MDLLLQDIRYAIRNLSRNVSFVIVAALTLALGIGATTAIFSVVNSVLLKPLPYPESERILFLWENSPRQELSVSYQDFQEWQKQATSFERMAIFRRESLNLTGSGEPERVQSRMVSGSFFGTLQVQPARGRDFIGSEDTPGGSPVVILTHGFWERKFGGDTQILGKKILLNEKLHTVVGILPQNFLFLSGADLFIPLAPFAQKLERQHRPGMYVMGRLKPGVTFKQARTEMDMIAARLAKQFPDSNGGITVKMQPLMETVTGDIKRPLIVLFAAVLFVVLIACANIANMMLARSTARKKELAIRTALGAGRGVLVRQLLTESVILGIIGGVIGFVLAQAGIDVLLALEPANLPRLEEIGIDTRVLAFTSFLSIATGLIFGLFPALHVSSGSSYESLKQTFSTVGGTHQKKTRYGLVVLEFALALVLLIGAGLLIKSFLKVRGIDPGFDANDILTVQMSLPIEKFKGRDSYLFLRNVSDRIQSLPGVKSVAFTNGLPIFGAGEGWFFPEGMAKVAPGTEPTAVNYIVSSKYFETMDIQLIKGRLFTEQDDMRYPVAVVDEALARTYYPNQDPVGKRLSLGPGSPMFEIVGLVRHVVQYGLDSHAQVEAEMYLPINAVPDEFVANVMGEISFVIETSGDPGTLSTTVREQIFSIDPAQPVFDVQTMSQLLADSIAPRRFSTVLLFAFSIIALLLAAVGIYGVLSYLVAQRTREIGIRMSLGATRSNVLRMVLSEGLLLTVLGVGIGVGVSFFAVTILTSLLYNVSATDPLTYIGTPLMLSLIALLACYFPARRATRINPIQALRYE
jgi:putative ABC transport system permease protein